MTEGINTTQSKKQNKKQLLLAGLVIAAVLAVASYWLVTTLTNTPLDERYIDDSSSVGEGVKMVFVDASTGRRIRGKKVALWQLGGGFGGMSDVVFESGKTDRNGVFFADLSDWNWTYMTIHIEDYLHHRSYYGYVNGTNDYITKNTEELELQYLPKTSRDSIRYRATDIYNNVLINTPVTINVNECGSLDSCGNVETTTNVIGNIIIDKAYREKENTFEIEGYKPVALDSKAIFEPIKSYVQLTTLLDERYIDDSSSQGNGVKMMFIDATTGRRIRYQLVSIGSNIVSGNGTVYPRELFEGTTDNNGVIYLELSPEARGRDSEFYVRVEGYKNTNTYQGGEVENEYTVTNETTDLMLQYIPEDDETNKVYHLVDTNGKELANTAVTIDVSYCGGLGSCNNAEISSNMIGNILISGDYGRTGNEVIIEGYNPVKLVYNKLSSELIFEPLESDE